MREIRHQSHEEWLATRRKGLGASDAPVILGLSRFKSPYQLYCEKLGLIENDTSESEAAEWGLALEGPIRARFTRDTCRLTSAIDPPFTVYQHDTLDWMFATLDAWQHHPDYSVRLPLEIKTGSISLAGEWKEEAPLEYVVQIQHQMAVTGTPLASVAALIGGQRFRWGDIPRDDVFIAKLIEIETEFWQRLIDRNPPPVDGTEQTKRTLAKVFSDVTGEVIALPPEAIDWDAKLVALKKIVKDAEKEKTLYENQIKAVMGGAVVGQLSNGVIYTWKEVNRKGYTVQPTSYRNFLRKGAKGEE